MTDSTISWRCLGSRNSSPKFSRWIETLRSESLAPRVNLKMWIGLPFLKTNCEAHLSHPFPLNTRCITLRCILVHLVHWRYVTWQMPRGVSGVSGVRCRPRRCPPERRRDRRWLAEEAGTRRDTSIFLCKTSNISTIFLHLSTSYGHWRHLTWKTEFCWLRNDMQLVLVNVWESCLLVASGCFIRSLHCLCLLSVFDCSCLPIGKQFATTIYTIVPSAKAGGEKFAKGAAWNSHRSQQRWISIIRTSCCESSQKALNTFAPFWSILHYSAPFALHFPSKSGYQIAL